MSGWRGRAYTNVVRYFLDDWLPPVLRENRLLFSLLAWLYRGRDFDLDFKRRAHLMSDEEYLGAYERLNVGTKKWHRPTDMTNAELAWVIDKVVGRTVLEVGCGAGVLAVHLAQQLGVAVTVSELSTGRLEVVRKRFDVAGLTCGFSVAQAENLPFGDKAFDTVVCAHTLEHVRRFEKAVTELVRVARRRLVIVVPCQRYYRYTVDYHLHFFPEPEQLLLRMGMPNQACERMTGDLCYTADLEKAGCET